MKDLVRPYIHKISHWGFNTMKKARSANSAFSLTQHLFDQIRKELRHRGDAIFSTNHIRTKTSADPLWILCSSQFVFMRQDETEYETVFIHSVILWHVLFWFYNPREIRWACILLSETACFKLIVTANSHPLPVSKHTISCFSLLTATHQHRN